MQSFVCGKVLSKAVWDEGDKESLIDCLQKEPVAGGEKLLSKLQSSDF